MKPGDQNPIDPDRPPHRTRFRPWPQSLAGRTALTLLLALMVVQGLGLMIHALDRIDLQRIAQARDVGVRVMSIYRAVASAPPDARGAVLKELDPRGGLVVSLTDGPPRDEIDPAPPEVQRLVRVAAALVPMPLFLRPQGFMIFGHPPAGNLRIAMHIPSGPWLDYRIKVPPPRPWHSPTFLTAFILMTAAAAVLILWATRRLTAPVRTLAAAAERLGRDVNAPPLAEDGPSEVATAAAAFNTMAARIRRFVQDRTFLLTAIGHDLRTPITRLKLRAEFMEDDEQRAKMLADLDELEAMVTATLAFGRDAASAEPVTPLDLPTLLRVILDENADARPEVAERLKLEGPTHLPIRARPVSLKRALGNLVGNAIKYGDSACVTVHPPRGGMIAIEVEDEGPGIPPDEMERVFEPFHRVETSRNRETGGTGLGLPIARNILRAHGGDVSLANRATGGTRALVTLPV
jgi:signal transduction histidine kinase